MRFFESRLSPAAQAVAIALTIWALVVVMPDVNRLFHPMGTLGLTADNNGEITVNGPPANAADIVNGDHLDLRLMSCARNWSNCRNTMAIFGGMGGTQYVLRPGQDVTLPVIRNSESRTRPLSGASTVTLHAAPATMTFWDRTWLAADEAGALAFIALALALVWKRPGVLTWGFFLYAIWFNPGQYFISMPICSNGRQPHSPKNSRRQSRKLLVMPDSFNSRCVFRTTNPGSFGIP